MHKYLKWPEKPTNNLIPWWLMAWRLLFVPTLYLGMSIAYLSVLMSRGLKEANYYWDKIN